MDGIWTGAFAAFVSLLQWVLNQMVANSFLLVMLGVPLILGLIAIIFGVFRRS